MPGRHARLKTDHRAAPREAAATGASARRGLRAVDAGTSDPDQFALRIEDALRDFRRWGRGFSVAVIGLHPLSALTRWRDMGLDRQIALNLETGVRSIRRSSDVLVRFDSGDFGILCTDIGDPVDALETAHRIADAVARPVTRNKMSVRPIVSAGVVIAEERHSTAMDLLTEARLALQHARSLDHTAIELFDEHMRARLLARFDAVNGIEQAVLSRSVNLLYQPIVPLRDDLGNSFEALFRPRHGTAGDPSTEDVIAFAEESGDIAALGMRVLREACLLAADWPFPDDTLGRVHVNVSAAQLASPRFVTAMERAIEESGAPAERLGLEITERVPVSGEAIAILHDLSDLGVHLSLDDFGTGFASLGSLPDLPLDAVKLDASLISSLSRTSTAIVNAVVSLARALDLEVVAEGVETARHLQVVRALGCDYAQGYHMGMPLPLEALRSEIA